MMMLPWDAVQSFSTHLQRPPPEQELKLKDLACRFITHAQEEEYVEVQYTMWPKSKKEERDGVDATGEKKMQ